MNTVLLMKRLFILLIALCLLSGCSKNDTADNIEDSSPAPSITAVPTATTTPEPEITLEPTQAPQTAVLDEDITNAVTTYIYESFGGSGKEEYAASWFKYIDHWEIYKNESTNEYNGIVFLTEKPYDYSARLLLSKYYSEEQLDILCPILMDVGATFNLDDIDLCLVGENLYNINLSNDIGLYISSLAAYDIPVYEFLATGFGATESQVREAIRNNELPGDSACECLIDYMGNTYEGAFDGLSMEKTKNIAMSALANFKDVRIESMGAFDLEGSPINSYNKLN